MSVFKELSRRGLIAQMTHPEKIEEILDKGGATFYIGFDPTADSLHVGHFLQLIVMSHLQKAGHRPIALLGTGTTMVGDPTGKTDMRRMMSYEEIQGNAENFKKQMSRFIDFSDGRALMVQNGDWLMKLNYVEFLRDVGVHFSVNKMLTADCFKTRLEGNGLTFIEFNYMLMQSYDFLRLNREYNCIMQAGGNDQWANILGGIELIRRADGKEAYGMTFTLLTTREGIKMGKTERGALWLDPEKTPPYEFFQYWRNVDDADVINCLKLLTFIPINEIEEMERSLSGSGLNKAKELLAHELTKLVHGADEADKALNAAKAVFGAGAQDENMPTTALSDGDFDGGSISALDLLVKTELAASKSEARRLIAQGGILVGDEKLSDANAVFAKENLAPYTIIKKGKKVYHKVTV